MRIEWWYWVIAGFCLIGVELILPSFTIIWFGMGALVVGVLSGLWPDLSLVGQIVLWPLASIGFSAMWFKYLKPKGNRPLVGMTKEGIVGETGVIVCGTEDSNGEGIVKFRVSVLGTYEWACYSSEALHVNDRVRVIDIEGQILKVEII